MRYQTAPCPASRKASPRRPARIRGGRRIRCSRDMTLGPLPPSNLRPSGLRRGTQMRDTRPMARHDGAMRCAQTSTARQCARQVGARASPRCGTRGSAASPGLAVVLVGEDPASAVYVRNKRRACARRPACISDRPRPAGRTSEPSCCAAGRLNADPAIDGILVQLPLPGHIDPRGHRGDRSGQGRRWFPSVQPRSPGAQREPLLRPCTPYGIVKLLAAARLSVRGLEAVVVGPRTSSAGRWRSSCCSPGRPPCVTARPATLDRTCGARSCWWSRSGARTWCAGVGPAGRDRNRRRHEPRADGGWSGMSSSRGP